MNHEKNILKCQTAINKMILNTVPNRYEFDKYQESRISNAFAEMMQDKIKFTWSDCKELDSKILKGEVAVLSVDEYKQLLRDFNKLKVEYDDMRRRYYVGGGF